VQVWSLDEARRLQAAPLVRVFPSGIKPVFRLRLASGREIKASSNHRFLSYAGWTELADLALGDRIAVPRRVPAALNSAVAVGAGAPSRDPLARLAVALGGGPVLEGLATDDVYWDRVAEIEPLGEQPVYDGTVVGTHNFIANGIVAHNSIEQDADLVMFLYRDEYYNREKSEKPGIAEIIVAKHRNGPTGMVELMFRKELTRFENLARDRRSEVPAGPDS
jgi:replicative DNA helicase